MVTRIKMSDHLGRVAVGMISLLLLTVIPATATPIIHLGADTLGFGCISLSGNHARELQISNDGDRPLIISSVNLGRSVFTRLYPSLPDTVAAGHFVNFRIKFDPAAEIHYDTVAIFHSNDPITPNARMALRAVGVRDFQPGEIIWSYQGIGDVVSLAVSPDINNDGFQDLVAESYSPGAHGDHLLGLSGSGSDSTKLIWSARPVGGDSVSGGIGDQCVISIHDLDSNGTSDIVFGSAWNSQTVFGIEGKTGQTIWSYNTIANPPHGYIYSVASLGDINGDSIPEVLAGAGSDANAALCLNGRDGSCLWRAVVSDAVYSVCGIDDVNGDGFPDVVAGTGDNSDLIFCLSSLGPDSLRTIWRYYSGGSVLSLSRIDDINGDQHNDVVAGVSFGLNEVVALSGYSVANPAVIWRTIIGAPVMKVVTCPDLNHDGNEDVLVASWADYALALSGADGSELWRNDLGQESFSTAWIPDVTGDSIPDVIIGGFGGTLTLIDGVTGQTVWITTTAAPILTLRSIADVNGDGFPDVIAGQEKDSNYGGKVLLISGGTLNPSSISSPNPKSRHELISMSNYPNPFNSQTTIIYYLQKPGIVELEIFNILGQRVSTLVDGYQNAGPHNVLWDACASTNMPVATGIYLSRLTMGNQKISSKLVILK